jgi:hypothetical protein
MEWQKQKHCSSCKVEDPKLNYVMLTQNDKDIVVGLCPLCLGALVSCGKDETVTMERIPLYRIERAERR